MAAGVRVDELRELGEDLHDLVGALSAGGHHDHVGLALLGDGVLEHGLAASERSRDESGAALGDRVEGVDAADAGLHDLLWPWFLLVGLDGDLDRPFLGHRDVGVLTVGIGQHRDNHIDVVLAGLGDLLHGVLTLEGERNHDLVRQPAFLHLSEPVGGDNLVTFLGDRGEVPHLLVVQRVGVLSSLEEH